MASTHAQLQPGETVLKPNEQICPDPSAHTHSHGSNLPDKAAGAALYNTSHDRAGGVNTNYPLDADNKLSSAGAAMSLKYARAHELPSFPSVGIDARNSPYSAANLAHKNQKPFEHWKPDPSANASKAAMLAKDYKMQPLWQPQASEAGSKAALLAHSGPGREWWQPESTKAGSAAAMAAIRTKGLSPKAYGGASENDKANALLAATSVHGRKRSGSTPAPLLYPDAANAQRNSLNAATVADSNRLGSKAMEAARVQNLGKNVTPKMFTEHPPIAWDVEDKKHDAALQASAISMAKQMYAVQKVHDDGTITIDHGEAAARSANNNSTNRSSVGSDIHQQALQYISLQDAAQKLAAERLSKIQHPDETAAFRDYYGYGQRKPRSRMSMRAPRDNKRASSEGRSWDVDSSDDEMQASRIRSRQSQLTNQLAEVDASKRDDDRKKLMAAAERRVHAQMLNMDKKVYDDTGKMSQAMVEDWDSKARARAAAASEARMQNHGKVSIGGGKWMDQAAIDAIAAARVKPTLDQINDTAEKQRARDEEIRLDNEMQKRMAREEKARVADEKAEQKRIKHLERDQEKARKAEEKRAVRETKDAEKARRAEEKRSAQEEKQVAKQENRKSTEPASTAAAETAVVTSVIVEPAVLETVVVEPVAVEQERPATANSISSLESDDDEELRPTASIASVPITAHRTASKDEPTPSAATRTDPEPHKSVTRGEEPAVATTEGTTSPTSPVKSRFGSILNKLKPKSKAKDTPAPTATATKDNSNRLSKDSTTGAPTTTTTASTTDEAAAATPSQQASTRRYSSSELSDSDEDELYSPPTREQAPLPKLKETLRGRQQSRQSRQSGHSSLATEEFEEARDTLVAPAPVPAYTSSEGQSPSRGGSKFHEEV